MKLANPWFIIDKKAEKLFSAVIIYPSGRIEICGSRDCDWYNTRFCKWTKSFAPKRTPTEAAKLVRKLCKEAYTVEIK